MKNIAEKRLYEQLAVGGAHGVYAAASPDSYLLRRLTEREQRILRMRFFEGRTQMEVAGEIGISQAQVSRLEKNALQHMRKYVSES